VPASRHTTLLLVRHGGTTAGADHFAGSIDVPLSDDGLAQAAALSRRLAEVRIDAMYSSPLQRAMQTANAIASAHGMTPQPNPDLREIAHGHWEGRSISDVKSCFADEYAASDARGLTTEQIAVVQKHRKDFEAIAKELGLDDVAEARRLAQRVALHLL